MSMDNLPHFIAERDPLEKACIHTTSITDWRRLSDFHDDFIRRVVAMAIEHLVVQGYGNPPTPSFMTSRKKKRIMRTRTDILLS